MLRLLSFVCVWFGQSFESCDSTLHHEFMQRTQAWNLQRRRNLHQRLQHKSTFGQARMRHPQARCVYLRITI